MFSKILAGLIVFFLIIMIGFFISTLDVPDIPERKDNQLSQDDVEMVKEWIKENASTYNQREGSNLEHLRTVIVEEDIFELSFSFQSNYAGYGPKKDDEVAAQVITDHIIVVTLKEGDVVSAITDEKYDEIEEELIKTEDAEEEKEVKEKEEETMKARLYFYSIKEGVEEVSFVEREFLIPEDEKLYTLSRLIEGPTKEEQEKGYQTAIEEGVKINSLYIEDSIAYADFCSRLDASGSARVTMIRDQIEKTLLQFNNVNEVIISIEGETEEILQP